MIRFLPLLFVLMGSVLVLSVIVNDHAAQPHSEITITKNQLAWPRYDQNLTAISVENEATAINRILRRYQMENGIAPTPRITDAVFMRRTYLLLAGRIPSHAEATTFLGSLNDDKRERLIDELLEGPGWIAHQFNFWADLLRIKTRMAQGASGMNYARWLEQKLTDNAPYDEMVKELITASGAAYEKGNGAVGFYVRDFGMPLDHMANTMQVFLGTQMQCAQCHNHPFDVWTQQDFYRLAAFTDHINVSNRPDKKYRKTMNSLRKKLSEDQDLRNAVRDISRVIGMGVEPGMEMNGKKKKERGTIKLPPEYQYSDAEPGERISVRVPFGLEANLTENQDPRQVFADWMCNPQNPRFTTVITNRLWKQLFGRALHEPLDDIRMDTELAMPTLQEHLNQLMIRCKYDMKLFVKVLCQTDLYHREAVRDDAASDEGKHFYYPGPLLRRLSAEQIWDSVLTMIIPDVDEREGRPRFDQTVNYERFKDTEPNAESILAAAQSYVDGRNLQKELRRKARNMQNKIKKEKDARKRRALQQEIGKLYREADSYSSTTNDSVFRQQARDPRWRNLNRNFVRAHKLNSPENGGHFLRRFGQSDREQIDNSHRSSTVPQLLTFMNGLVDNEMAKRESVVSQTLQQYQGLQRAEAAFILILSRPPRPDELQSLAAYDVNKREDMLDIVWSLLNAREFMFIQ